MRVLFDYHELWDVVESAVSALGDNATEAHYNWWCVQMRVLFDYHELWDVVERWSMETTETIDVYINKVIALTNKMKTNGETHSEQAKVEKILRSLTPKFEHVVVAIEKANDISKMTVSSYHEHGSYFSKGRGGQNHGGAWRGERGRRGREGCTNHMCGKKELFADLDDSFHTKVKFGDGRFVPVSGKGRILITLKNGDHRYIYDVLPDMKSNLLSMGQLAEKGYVFGSITYAHIPKTVRSKLDDKVVKTIFIGYKHGGYKLYNPMTKKVIVSRDVTFAEDEEWQWNAAAAEIDSKKRYIYVLNDDMEDGVTLEAPAVQPEVVIQPEVATPIATMMERPRRQQRQLVHLQDCKVNLDEVDDNGDLVHFAFLAESEPVRLVDVIQHPK
ncbi:uncharacterized protein [Phaseolus vulgaris]|uniref:uncharacterized protein n=1 Tax=Phaseolus vulgaris TaxID=3885 RepID=UPI0035CB449D